ncbi:MAG: DUF72 domain-containing protein [Allosphingosinicella sp.]
MAAIRTGPSALAATVRAFSKTDFLMSPIVGTAGWTIPGKDAPQFGPGSSALERYATRFAGVEVNSSFHRPHRRDTWVRWGDSVPAGFRFSVKLPKTISHERRLVDCGDLVARFLNEVSGLGDRLAILLLQLPPKLAFDPEIAERFLSDLAAAAPARLVCEPRHPSWFEPAANTLLDRLEIARVAADPAIVPDAALPGGWRGLSYWRLHGSPRMYRSSYDDGRLDHYSEVLRKENDAGRAAWCMFDNTAGSSATGDALGVIARL